LAGRIALGRGQVERATSLITRALDTARAAGQPRAVAAAAYCAGLLRVAIGDLDGADGDLSTALAAARTGRDPLRAVRIRLMQTEVERRRGRHNAAQARLDRLARIARTLPPLLLARMDLLRSVLEASGPGGAADPIARLVSATGLGALPIYAGGTRPRGTAGDPIESLAGEVIAIVHACQTAADEAVVLKDVCGRVRRQIHATAVAFVAGPLHRYAALSSVGPRIEASAAERAVTAGLTNAPHRHEDRVEAAVPVRYGGVPIGALCARWTLGSTYEIRRAAAAMEMAAAAAAPVVSAFLGRREGAARAGPI
jgi:hypothetical protein